MARPLPRYLLFISGAISFWLKECMTTNMYLPFHSSYNMLKLSIFHPVSLACKQFLPSVTATGVAGSERDVDKLLQVLNRLQHNSACLYSIRWNNN